jgi:ferredoxin-like protein FixX
MNMEHKFLIKVCESNLYKKIYVSYLPMCLQKCVNECSLAHFFYTFAQKSNCPPMFPMYICVKPLKVNDLCVN